MQIYNTKVLPLFCMITANNIFSTFNRIMEKNVHNGFWPIYNYIELAAVDPQQLLVLVHYSLSLVDYFLNFGKP